WWRTYSKYTCGHTERMSAVATSPRGPEITGSRRPVRDTERRLLSGAGASPRRRKPTGHPRGRVGRPRGRVDHPRERVAVRHPTASATPYLTSSSAIWMVLSAAPFRRLSPDTTRLRPVLPSAD